MALLDQIDIFEPSSVSSEDRSNFKNKILQCILATDMALDKSIKDKLNDKIKEHDISDGQNIEHLIDKTSQQSTEASK